MKLSEGIRRIGFRRWYERQLMESHCYFVTAFLCLIVVMACVEGFSLRAPGLEPFLRLVAMFTGGAIGMWALVRYKTLLETAQHAAEHSVCGKCAAYGLLELAAAGAVLRRPARTEEDPDAVPSPVGVRCRKCGHEWTIQ